VYLSDVFDGVWPQDPDLAFSASRWFTRGWTLQELLAPKMIRFYDASWRFFGTRGGRDQSQSLTPMISQITRIPADVLDKKRRSRGHDYSVAQKMSWAANRTTTRIEDIAYCLLGIFDVNMPLLYGEGDRAFVRLQEEIIKASDDESIFVGGFQQTPKDDDVKRNRLFATSPSEFTGCGDVVVATPKNVKASHYALTNKGLHTEMSICKLAIDGWTSLIRLNCSTSFSIQSGRAESIAIPIINWEGDPRIFYRDKESAPVLVSSEIFPRATGSGPNIYIRNDYSDTRYGFACGFKITYWFNGEIRKLQVSEIYPPLWRGILTSNAFMWRQLEPLTSGRQNIMFICNNFEIGRKVAVKIDYTFHLEGNVLQPLNLKAQVAVVERHATLAEYLLESTVKPYNSKILNWEDELSLENFQLKFQLDKSAKVDLNGVASPSIGNYNWTLNVLISHSKGADEPSPRPFDTVVIGT